MTGDRLNYLNMGLMALAALLAFVVPFELFLFSYAVLGPLHYLTEISWLHQRGYFTQGKRDYWALAVLCAGLVVSGLLLGKLVDAMLAARIGPKGGYFCLFVAFGIAPALVLLRSALHRVFAAFVVVVLAVVLQEQRSVQSLVTVFLPTLIHVVVFTWAFMLFGALKERSRSGLVQCAAFLVAPVLFWILSDAGSGRQIDDAVKRAYFPAGGGAGLGPINAATLGLIRPKIDGLNDVFYSSQGLLVGRLVAYAYTYHYLNWFSKTSLIGWHKVSRPRLALVLALWLLSIGLYVKDYKLGLTALYGLSFLHVFLEFPLNHLSFVGIGKELAQIVRTRRFAHA